MSRFRIRYAGSTWDADLIQTPDGKTPLVWQIYGYPMNAHGQGLQANHWVPYGEAQPLEPDQVNFTVSSPQVTETDGPSAMVFTVQLTAPQTTTVTLDYTTQDGTAIAGEDYTPTSGTLIFAPGETTKTVTVAIVGDGVSEPTESFSLAVSNPATAAPPTLGTGTIYDDDFIPNGAPYGPLGEFGPVLEAFWDLIPKPWRKP